MGITNLPPYAAVVSGASGYVSVPLNPYDGSISNPISGWNTQPTIQYGLYKTKFQFSSDDKKSHVRYEDDEGEPHAHYEDLDDYGFRLTFYLSGELTLEQFYRKAQEFKILGNGFVRNVRRLLHGTSGYSPRVTVVIMRLCPNCNSEISAASTTCPACGKQL